MQAQTINDQAKNHKMVSNVHSKLKKVAKAIPSSRRSGSVVTPCKKTKQNKVYDFVGVAG